jgi:hypothetical protein
MDDWMSVTVIKMGMDVRIIVAVPCPSCQELVPIEWTGSPKNIYPDFPKTGRCNQCQRDLSVEIPRRSIIRWWYLAKMELQQVIKDDEKRHLASNKSSKSKRGWKRKMKKEHLDAIRQQNYGFILSENRAS